MQYVTPFLPPFAFVQNLTPNHPNRRHRTRSRPKKDTPLKRELRREREGAEGAEKARASEVVPLRANRIGQVAMALRQLRNRAG